MDRQNPFASPDVGEVDDNPPIEAARAQQRGIEHVRTVGRRDEDYALVRLESIHFDEELIERLLPFIVPATEPGPSVPADGVDPIDEHDAGGMLLALLEQVADAGCPDAYEHLNEIRAADREERHVRFGGDRARQQRFAGPRRSHQEHALWNASAQLLELLRLFEERNDLLQLLAGFVDARDVLKGHLLLRAGRQRGLALAEREHRGAAARHLPNEEDQN